MSGVLSFLLSCAFLAFCLLVGFFVLNFGFGLLYMVGVGIFAAIAWVWQKLTKRDWPDEPRL